MNKTVSYICTLCDTLVHNNICACGNAGAKVNTDGSVIKLYVDDISTLKAVNSFIDIDGNIKRLDYYSGTPKALSENKYDDRNRYRRIASDYFKYSSLTNQKTNELFKL